MNDLRHLELELSRIDLLLQREIRRWVVAGQDPNDDYRGLYIPRTEAELLGKRPFCTSWGQWVALPPAEEEAFRAAADRITGKIEEVRAAAGNRRNSTRLQHIFREFELDRVEQDIFLLCLAPAFDTKYARIFGYLQDNVTHCRPSVRLVLDLLGGPGVEKFALARYLERGARLFNHGLLIHADKTPPADSDWISRALHVDQTVTAWLRGSYVHTGPLAGHVRLDDSRATDVDEMLIVDALHMEDARRFDAFLQPVVALIGADRNRQDAAARLIAREQGCPLLVINLEACLAAGTSVVDAVRLGLRDARLTRSIAYLQGWDAGLTEDGHTGYELAEALFQHRGVTITSSRTGWRPVGPEHRQRIRWVQMDMPGYNARLGLWQHYLNGSSASVGASAIADLAGRFNLSSGMIRDAVAAARDRAGDNVVTAGQLFAAARAYSSPRLSTLARKIEPRYGWSDIILPESQLAILQEMVATVQQRPTVLEVWGVGRKLAAGAGVSMLFAGPPGTGKTMAAEVVAGELGLDLYKIDLSSVVSKYIGETEKNLERIFSEAASSNAILFFDEADAIFGKRAEVKDAHDRYANVEISYLLQRMESYDGVTILATNLRGNLDEAFTRRLHFAVDFPFPSEDDRLRIWQTLFPAEVPRADDLDFALLARKYELPGGNIRNVIVGAAYLAASNGQMVTMEYLLKATRRELRKMGRSTEPITDIANTNEAEPH